jgi:multidrug efflux system membrane fusion protein
MSTQDTPSSTTVKTPSGKTPGRRRLALYIAAAAVVGLTLAWLATRGSSGRANSGNFRNVGSTPVSAATAQKGVMNTYLTALGTVTAWNTVTVKSRADGQLLKLHFTDGQHVQAGDVLADIDPRAYKAALEQAEGQLARDRALLANAKLDLERNLSASEAVSAQQVDTAKSTVAQYEGVVRADQGNVDNDRLQLGYCTVTAPISGRTGIRNVDEGNLIHASDASGLVTITQDTPIAVFFSIPEDRLQRVLKALNSGKTLEVEAYNRSMERQLAKGEVVALDNAIDTGTGTVRLKAKFDNADGALFPNQFVNIRMLVGSKPDATLIPVSAVQISGKTRYVFVVGKDGTVERRTVKPGQSEGNFTSIEDGLAPGEVVATEGIDKLRDGAKVIVVEPGKEPPAPAPQAKDKSKWQHRQDGGADKAGKHIRQ